MTNFIDSLINHRLIHELSENEDFIKTGFTVDTSIIELEEHYESKRQLEKLLNARIDLAYIASKGFWRN